MVEASPPPPPTTLVLKGYEDRINDVLYAPPTSLSNVSRIMVVYFGGDIQDFSANMETHRDNKNYTEFSLENTTSILQKAFPSEHILVVRPFKMEYKTFSCFENFVPSGNCGVPHHSPMYHSLDHLHYLLKNLCERTDQINDHRLILIGFSKGCVVLNQFLYEFATINAKTEFIARIQNMYWLDGGHSGGNNTWIGAKRVLEAFAKLCITVHIHVSPYQIQDERRPWIRQEEKIFYSTLMRLKVGVYRCVHFSDMLPSILQHFKILYEFSKTHSSHNDT